jgi:DNA-directed RNA polymerase subunit M/transcription elongation factor TFIIS
MSTTRDILKNNIILVLTDILNKYDIFTKLSQDDQNTLIRRFERAMWNTSLDEFKKQNGIVEINIDDPLFISKYSTISYKVLSNLDKNTVGKDFNTEPFVNILIDCYLKQNKTFKDIILMDSQEMCYEASKEERELIALKMEQKVEKKYTERHACPKCGTKKAEIHQLNNRALDELTDYKATCCNCQYQWIV